MKARISTLTFKDKEPNTNLQKIRTAVLVLGNPAVENAMKRNICISKHNADWLHYQTFTALLCFNALSELSIFLKIYMHGTISSSILKNIKYNVCIRRGRTKNVLAGVVRK